MQMELILYEQRKNSQLDNSLKDPYNLHFYLPLYVHFLQVTNIKYSNQKFIISLYFS